MNWLRHTLAVTAAAFAVAPSIHANAPSRGGVPPTTVIRIRQPAIEPVVLVVSTPPIIVSPAPVRYFGVYCRTCVHHPWIRYAVCGNFAHANNLAHGLRALGYESFVR